MDDPDSIETEPMALCVDAAGVGVHARPGVDPPRATPALLFASLYSELCRLARRERWRSGAHHLVGTRTVVHEAWLQIGARPAVAFEDAGRFLGYAARTMRGLVIDRIRAHRADKRGGGVGALPLDDTVAEQLAQPALPDGIAEALDELETLEPELAQVVDLKFFCGFSLVEIARMRGVSERTVQRQWDKARLLLYTALR